MKFNEAISMATQAADVEGVTKRVGPIVRRPIPPGVTIDERKPKKKKKKKKKKDEDDK